MMLVLYELLIQVHYIIGFVINKIHTVYRYVPPLMYLIAIVWICTVLNSVLCNCIPFSRISHVYHLALFLPNTVQLGSDAHRMCNTVCSLLFTLMHLGIVAFILLQMYDY